MNLYRISVVFCAVLLLAAGCAEELAPRDDASVAPEGGEGPIRHEASGSGWISAVDASAEDGWVHLDMDGLGSTSDAALRGDEAWELAFQRFKIATNSGISGPGDVRVAALRGADFEGLAEAPAAGWRQDAADGDDADVDPDLAFLAPERWYDYNPSTHVLTPADVVYVVQTGAGAFFKVRVLDYYSAAGSPAHLRVEWAPVAPPPGGIIEEPDEEPGELGEGLVVDASGRDVWVYVDVEAGAVVPEGAAGWDLAFQRTQVRTHSGTSGSGLGGALEVAGSWAAVTSAGTVGYREDELVPLPGPPGSGEVSANAVLSAWYDYDPQTHAVTPRDAVFVVRTADGGYAKAQVTGYADGKLSVKLEEVPVAPEVRQVTLAPAEAGGWTHLSLRRGEIVAAEEAPLGWDLAVSGVQVRTNGGTSGAGEGAAAEVSSALDASGSLAVEGLAADEVLPLPGPPGSGEASANAALSAWYDYDPQTHAVTPRDAVFVVRTADGGYARVRVDGYADGALTLSWIYAGAGRDAL